MRAPLSLRIGAAVVLTAALTLAVPLAASAHVRIYPKEAVAGADDTLLTFAVPNESAGASTTKVVIDLPTATPFGDVSYQPVAGWSAEIVTTKLPKPAKIEGTTVTAAPTSVVWTADAGTTLQSEQFQQFVLSVGPMPSVGSIPLPTTQTYSDGTVVRWDEPTPSSGDEPEHPAPTLYVNDAPPSTDRTPGSATVSASTSGPQVQSTVAIVLASTGVVLAVLALVVGLLALRRRSARRGE